MTEKIKYVLVFAVVVSICLGFGIYLFRPNTSIGVSTDYDKNAILNTLSTLKSYTNSRPSPTYNDVRLSLIKQCLVLPASIYTDLMYEFKKQATEADKIKNYKTMVDLYIKALGSDYKKTFVLTGGGKATQTEKFQIKSKVFNIIPKFAANQDQLVTLNVYKYVNSKPKLIQVLKNIESGKKKNIDYGEGEFHIYVDSNISYWELTITDGE